MVIIGSFDDAGCVPLSSHSEARGGKTHQYTDDKNVMYAQAFIDAKKEALELKTWRGLSKKSLSKKVVAHILSKHGEVVEADVYLNWFNRIERLYKKVKEDQRKSGGKNRVGSTGRGSVSVVLWGLFVVIFGSDLAVVPPANPLASGSGDADNAQQARIRADREAALSKGGDLCDAVSPTRGCLAATRKMTAGSITDATTTTITSKTAAMMAMTTKATCPSRCSWRSRAPTRPRASS
jgi:hypothetical protein